MVNTSCFFNFGLDIRFSTNSIINKTENGSLSAKMFSFDFKKAAIEF